MATAPKSDLPIKLTNTNRAAWIKQAQNYKAKHGNLFGFTEKYGYGYWPNKDGNFTLYRPDPDSTVKGGVKAKSYYGRLDSRTKNRIKRDNLALAQTFGEDTFPQAIDGKQVHHKRKLSQYSPFFEGATLEEARELARYAAEDLNSPLGNRLENAELIDPDIHTRHHIWERLQGYTRGKFSRLTKDGPFPSDFSTADLETRKYALNRFLLNEQPKIDANLLRLQQVADLTARPGRSLLSALPFVGIAAGGLEAKERTEKAMQTGNPLDQLQAGLAVGGQFPGAGNALDMLNSVVDMVRNPTAYTPQARYLQQFRNILPYGR